MQIIAGLYKNRHVQVPKGLKTRPTSSRLREALFNICQGCHEEARFLDLFAGSGAMGLEALSRGAKRVTFVDNSKESIRCIHANVEALGVEKHVQVVYGEVFEVLLKLAKKGATFDIIYADPPYDLQHQTETETISFSGRVLQLIDANIGLLDLAGDLFLEDAVDAIPEEGMLQHLVLKSSRRMGRSVLQHYVRKPLT